MILICLGKDSQIVFQIDNAHAGRSVRQTRQLPKCNQSTQIRLIVLIIRPSTGLDPVQCNLMMSLLRRLGRSEFRHGKDPEEASEQSSL